MGNNKTLIIIGVGVLLYFILKKKNTSTEGASKIIPDSIIADSFDVNSVVTSNMSPEEKMQALAEAEEKAQLRNEYAVLFGKAAPSYYTVLQLAMDIANKKAFDTEIKNYIQQTGDTTKNDGIGNDDFTTIAEIQNTLLGIANANQAKKVAWNNRKNELRAMAESLYNNFKDDGTWLKRKGWNETLLNTLHALSNEELTFVAQYYASIHKSMATALTGGNSVERKGYGNATRLANRIKGLNLNATVNEFGEFTV